MLNFAYIHIMLYTVFVIHIENELVFQMLNCWLLLLPGSNRQKQLSFIMLNTLLNIINCNFELLRMTYQRDLVSC